MIDYDFLRIGAGLSFVSRTVSGSGLLTIALDTASGAMVECADGISIGGVRITDGGGVDATAHAQYHEAMVILRGKPGATATIVHEDAGESEAHRIRCSTGANMQLEADSFVVLVYRLFESRWVAHDLRGAAGPEGPAGPDRLSTYTGTTAGAGTYSVSYGSPYTNTPVVVVQLVGGSADPHQWVMLTSSTVAGFTATAYQRNSANLLGVELLAASSSPVNGLTVVALVYSLD